MHQLSEWSDKYLLPTIRILLIATAIVPFVYTPSLLFPFVFSKAILFRILVEISLILVFIRAVVAWYEGREVKFFLPIRNPLFLATTFFFVVSAGVSALFADNVYRALWGDIERIEGLFGLLHYVVFFLLIVSIFRKKDWMKFFGISLAVGFFISLYAWMQYFGIGIISASLGKTSQPGSFLGNPAYLAEYAILLVGFATILLSVARGNLRRFLWALILFEIATIFITQIRGALLGVAAGIVVLLVLIALFGARRRTIWKLSQRVLAVLLLALMFGSATLFWTTRTADVWQNVPGIRRFAKAEIGASSSVVTRLIALGVSWDAFKERPIIGWGPENYNIAYNKHYNPAYAYYAEDWFDRAHNKVAEVAVTQGAVGLASYLAIFGFLFAALYRLRREDFFMPALLGSVVVAYFIQNLFLFDTITSYVPLFAILGYVIVRENKGMVEFCIGMKHFFARSIASLAAFGAVTFLLIAVYVYNLLPAYQTRVYINAMRTKVGEKIFAAADSFLTPYTYAQSTIRAQFSDVLYDNGLFRDTKFQQLTDKAITSLEEFVEREPYEPRDYIRLIEVYSDYAKRDTSYFEQAEQHALRAVELTPKRQGVLYHLAFVYAGEGRYDEAFEVAQHAVDIDSRVYKSQYQLGIIYSLYADSSEVKGTPAQREYRLKAKEQFEKAWEMAGEQNDYEFFLLYDLNNIITINRVFNDNETAAKVLEVALERHPSFEKFYVNAIAVYRALREKDKLIAAAERLKELNITLTDDLDTIIDLTRKEKWNILDNL